MSKKKVYALLVEPNNKPKITELEEDDKAIREIEYTRGQEVNKRGKRRI